MEDKRGVGKGNVDDGDGRGMERVSVKCSLNPRRCLRTVVRLPRPSRLLFSKPFLALLQIFIE